MKEYKLSVTPLKYLDYVRNYRYCIVCLKNTLVEPHHLKAIGMGNNRKKELIQHYTAIPVCRDCHTEYHAKGEKYQADKYKMNHWKENSKILSEYLISELKKETL
tara:strand:+ start:7389 stop:7703 length:315 start_codon:yes stop_codon:yes gene_type:complete